MLDRFCFAVFVKFILLIYQLTFEGSDIAPCLCSRY